MLKFVINKKFLALDGRRASESRVPSYRNTFNEKDKGIEGRIINATYKTLITKISVISAELSLPENMVSISFL